MTAVKLADLLEGLEFSSFDGACESTAYVCRDTGRVYCSTDIDDFEEDLPQDLETSDQYIPMPHKRDLDLGRNLALNFIEEAAPADYDTALACFNARGAYSRFKGLLEKRKLLDTWYAYELSATETALRQWCDEHGLTVV